MVIDMIDNYGYYSPNASPNAKNGLGTSQLSRATGMQQYPLRRIALYTIRLPMLLAHQCRAFPGSIAPSGMAGALRGVSAVPSRQSAYTGEQSEV